MISPEGPDFNGLAGFHTNWNNSLVVRPEKHYNWFPLSLLPISLSMRSNLLATLLIAILPTSWALGCAFEGTIVDKHSRLRPDSSMTGTEGVYSFVFRGPTGTSRLPITVPNPLFWTESSGSYKFYLRDQQGHVHSQLVTPEVFARCQVGDYFNDHGPACQRPDSKDSKTTTVSMIHQRSNHRVAQAHRTHHRMAMHRGHRSKSAKMIALRASHRARQG